MREKIICEKCGSEMRKYREHGSCGMKCTKCDWSWATSFIPEISSDFNLFKLTIFAIPTPSIDVIKAVATLASCNFLAAKNNLQQGDIDFSLRAPQVLEYTNRLVPLGIDYKLSPECVYDYKVLQSKIKHLFECDWDEDLTEEQEDSYDDEADAIINTYGWDIVFEAANSYLRNNCKDPENVINFAHLYWIYGWHNNDIPNPYNFLAYFYHILDFKTAEYDDMDILNSLATTILPRAGYSNADTYIYTDYMPESDERMIAEARKFNV